ncbi:MAG: phosphoribosylglycinamide formyltransferase [Bacteroidota bacterium]
MNIAVFASGRGSNFEAILKAIDSGLLPVRVVLLLSNRSDAGALDLARSRGIPVLHLSRRQCSSDEDFARRMLAALEEHHAEFIALAGYLKRIPPSVLERYANRIVNIHPALLPFFGGDGMYGHFVHEAVLASGMKISGATVHLVDEEYDHGAILFQKSVEIEQGETAETLAQKVLNVEHEIFPLVLKAFAEGKVVIEGKKAWVIL